VLPRNTVLRIVAAASIALSPVLGTVSTAHAAGNADSIRSQEWWLDAMHAPDAIWNASTGRGTTVAVIDSGVSADAPDLVGQLVPGRNFSGLPGNETTDVADPGGTERSSGTATASLIAGTGKGLNGKGMYGLAPGAKIMPMRIVPKGANEETYSIDFAAQLSSGIRAAADSDAQILDISVEQTENEPDVAGAVTYALGKGKMIVAAVGDFAARYGNVPMYPSSLPGVVGVGALDSKGNVPSFSEHGTQVAFTAVGDGMTTACVSSASGYCTSDSTSDAAAMFSASAAVLWSVHPTWTSNQVIRVLKNTANSGEKPGVQDPYYGYGVVRPRIALTSPGDPGPADVSPLIDASASPTATPTLSQTPTDGTSSAPAPVQTVPTLPRLPQLATSKPSIFSGMTVGIIVGGVLFDAAGIGLAFYLEARRRRLPLVTGQTHPYLQTSSAPDR
jgi:subtilisin family serine protease